MEILELQAMEQTESGLEPVQETKELLEPAQETLEAVSVVEKLQEKEAVQEMCTPPLPKMNPGQRLFWKMQTKSSLSVNNAGVGVIEILLILVVLVALVLLFKNQLTSMVERAMEALEKSMERILS